jgi:glycerate 2-kinase
MEKTIPSSEEGDCLIYFIQFGPNFFMLAQFARQIFAATLQQIETRKILGRVVQAAGSQLLIRDHLFEMVANPAIYVIAVGKAAYPMAEEFSEIAGNWVRGGVLSGIVPPNAEDRLGHRWQVFSGGHPVPNEESLAAARACLGLLERADSERALVVFLISGGGSAMMELPRNEAISLADLQEFNRVLVTCGAAITEINAVRRAVSLVKGGALALRALNTRQISLIISDTSAGDLSSVASGPSLLPADSLPDAFSVVRKYDLAGRFPLPIIQALKKYRTPRAEKIDSRAVVLLDNEQMVREAAQIAGKMGLVVEIEKAAEDVPIAEGSEKLFSQFVQFRRSTADARPVCLLSGGEFGCRVTGSGVGGRNSETVLRLSLLAQREKSLAEYAVLSAGTDGIDGNSPAAGAVADQTTLERARLHGLDPAEYLQNSDSFNFFHQLNDSVITGATGTNVRDLRILIAGKHD